MMDFIDAVADVRRICPGVSFVAGARHCESFEAASGKQKLFPDIGQQPAGCLPQCRNAARSPGQHASSSARLGRLLRGACRRASIEPVKQEPTLRCLTVTEVESNAQRRTPSRALRTLEHAVMQSTIPLHRRLNRGTQT